MRMGSVLRPGEGRSIGWRMGITYMRRDGAFFMSMARGWRLRGVIGGWLVRGGGWRGRGEGCSGDDEMRWIEGIDVLVIVIAM